MYVRCSDNVLHSDMWTAACLTFVDGYITRIKVTHQGVYSLDDMVGWGLSDLTEWQNFDPTGEHPENYYEVSADNVIWHFLLSETEISALMDK